MNHEVKLPAVVNHASFFLMLRCIAQEAAMAYAHQEQMRVDILSARLVPLGCFRWIAYYEAVSGGGASHQIAVQLGEDKFGNMQARVSFFNDCWQFDAAGLLKALWRAPVKSQAEVVADAVNANFEADGKFDAYHDVEDKRIALAKAKADYLNDAGRSYALYCARHDAEVALRDAEEALQASAEGDSGRCSICGTQPDRNGYCDCV